jgi:hypothetical protein
MQLAAAVLMFGTAEGGHLQEDALERFEKFIPQLKSNNQSSSLKTVRTGLKGE